MPILVFRCPEGHVTERIVLSRNRADRASGIRCPRCDYYATRTDVERTGRPNVVGGTPVFFRSAK